MFGLGKDKAIAKLEMDIDELRDERRVLKTQVEDLKLKKKIEDEDIKHMVKMKTEALEMEHDKKGIKLEKDKDIEIHGIKDQYRDKMEKNLQEQLNKMDGMYKELLGRMPDINVRLKGSV